MKVAAAAVSGEAKDFPEYTARRTGRAVPKRPACTGPIAWKDRDAVRKDIENLQAAVKAVKAEEVFMTAASPGVVPHFMKDQYYGSEEKYLYALADALKEEYDAIHRAGFVLQVDCPDLCIEPPQPVFRPEHKGVQENRRTSRGGPQSRLAGHSG